MDPIAVLQSRIELLESKLGTQANTQLVEGQQQGESAVTYLLNTAAAVNSATVGHEKIAAAMPLASELTSYTDPSAAANIENSKMHIQEVIAAEQMIRNHFQCMQHCKKAAPVLESQPLEQVPQMQTLVDSMQAAAQEVKEEVDKVSQGVMQLAETCGSAAATASEQIADVSQKVEEVEQKLFPKRRNGLD